MSDPVTLVGRRQALLRPVALGAAAVVAARASARAFPNTQLYIEQTDFEFWTSADKTGPGRAVLYDHAARSLLPNRDRIVFIRDGQEFLHPWPGLGYLAA